MPITPHFTIQQTLSHVELDIRVPHVRVTPESIQVVLLENTILHFASPPYVLILNFAALYDDSNDTNATDGHGSGYRFHETASEACATYEPTIENGMIHLSLKKAAHAQTMWSNLHLLGRMVLPQRRTHLTKSNNSNSSNQMNNNMNKNPTSQWLLEEVASTTTTTTNTNDISASITNMRDDQEEEDVTEKKQTSGIKRKHGYGFAGMFDGIFSDLTRDGLAKEMLESPPDDDDDDEHEDPLLSVDIDDDENDESGKNTTIDSPSASYTVLRRMQRRRVENAKFDPDRYRQDLDDLDDDYIYQCAMSMKPHWIITSSGVGGDGGSCDNGLESVTKRLDSLAVNQESGNGMDDSSQPPSDGNTQQQRQESYFTEEERLQLVSIPYPLLSPETSLSRQQQQRQNGSNRDSDDMENDLTLGIVVGLVDLLFAYVYDHLTTDGDATVESAWTVSILSASLSWMEDWQHLSTSATTTTTTTRSIHDDDLDMLSAAAVKEVLYSSLRRALVYPYLRNLGFALHCARQVSDILHHGGPCCILRCLLQMRNVLNHSELYYLGNKLFIDPYLAWIQQQNSNLLSHRLADMAHVIQPLVSAFDNVTSVEQCKQSLGLDLMRIEQEEEMEHQQDEGQHSSSSSDSDDDSSSREETQSDEDDDKQLPELDHKEQHEFEKGTAVSSELLDCSLGFSALHIVKPRDNFESGAFITPTIIIDENLTDATMITATTK